MNFLIEYLHRDSGNYKIYNTVVVKGDVSTCTINSITNMLRQYMISTEFFYPSNVGLPYDGLECTDWCEIENISFTPEPPTEGAPTFTELVEKLKLDNTP